MKKVLYIFICLLIFITTGCQKKSKPISLTAIDSSISLYEDGSTQKINLSDLTITNSSSDNLVFSVTTLPEHGYVNISNETDGFFAFYYADRDYYGTDSFEYQVSNGDLTSSGTILIKVMSHNDDPISSHTHLMSYENTAITFDLSSIVIDIDSEELIYTIEVIPTNGMLELNGSIISYTPNTGFKGNDLFRYVVYDGEGGVSTNTISIDVISKIVDIL